MIVGSNSIFIYLFSETIGVQWLRGFGNIWATGILQSLGLSASMITIVRKGARKNGFFFTKFIKLALDE